MAVMMLVAGMAGIGRFAGAAFGEASEATSSTVPGDASLRFGTFNMQFLPTTASNAGCCEEIPDRPKQIAERIKASGYDVIALQEGLAEPARAALVAELKGAYPHYVQKITCNFIEGSDGISRATLDDSGLMLFSRYPFAPLLTQAYPDGYEADQRASVQAYSAGVDWWNQVACLNYNNAGLTCVRHDGDLFPEDDFAAKGVAHVRVVHPTSGELYNVFFTHTDAQCNVKRFAQMGQAARFIEKFAGSVMSTEAVIMMGDLNINGNLGTEIDDDGASTRAEWERFFLEYDDADPRKATQFYGNKMRDSWEVDKHSPDMPKQMRDKGITAGHTYFGSPRLYERLDYILRNEAVFRDGGRMCLQHNTIAYNLRGGNMFMVGGLNGGLFSSTGLRAHNAGDQEYSDHYGVNADINLRAPHCSSKDARILTGGDLNKPLPGRITHKGSMQWYRVDDPGTYAISTAGAGVQFDVYATTDTSSPIPSYRGQTMAYKDSTGTQRSGAKYALTGPFYVRVFHPDRTVTGDYQLVVHKAGGRESNDAVVLLPGVTQQLELPTAAVNAIDTTWFQVDTERSDQTTQFQTARFYAHSITSPDGSSAPVTLDLIDTAAVGCTSACPAPLGSINGTTAAKEIQLSPTTATKADGRTMFLRIQRPTSGARATGMTVGWETNLTIVEGVAAWPLRLMNLYQTDELSGTDEDLRLLVHNDGVLAANDVLITPSNWDHGEPRGVTSRLCPNGKCGAIRFVSSARLRLLEQDLANSDKLTGAIPPLAASQPLGTAPRYLRAGPHIDFTDLLKDPSNEKNGKYRLHYIRRHGATPLMGSLPTMTVTDFATDEGVEGVGKVATPAVMLSYPVPYPVTVKYATSDGSVAKATAGADYTATAGSLIFAPNETRKTIDIPVLADQVYGEPRETFMVNLTGAQGATLDDRQSVVSIDDLHVNAIISVADVSTEGTVAYGTSSAQFTIRLSSPIGQPVSVNYLTGSGSAVSGTDFTSTSGSVTIPAGATSASALVTVPLTGDAIAEANETFVLNINSSALGTAILDSQAAGTILDDDDVPPPPCTKCFDL